MIVQIPIEGNICLMRHYIPKGKSIMNTFPDPDINKDIIYATPAAFTNANGHIEGIHVSEGKYYCDVDKNFNGGFVYRKDGTFNFYSNSNSYINEVKSDIIDKELNCGNILTAFTNFILISNGKKHKLNVASTCHFRSIGDINGKLYMFVADKTMKIDKFVDELLRFGVQNAIYQDAAANWEYGWWRTDLSKIDGSSLKIKNGIYYWKGTGKQNNFAWSNAIYVKKSDNISTLMKRVREEFKKCPFKIITKK